MRKVMYIAINQDLNMSSGKIAAHAAHAAFDYLYSLLQKEEYNSICNQMGLFKHKGDTIIVLKAHEKDLLKWEQQGYISVRDRGLTEIKPNSITAVNLGVYDKDEGIPKWIQRLRLL